jgi:hypothetical protein
MRTAGLLRNLLDEYKGQVEVRRSDEMHIIPIGTNGTATPADMDN